METSMPRGVTAWTERSYAKSWVDRLQDSIERLPWAPWLTYVVVFLVLAGTETILKWNAGTYPVGTFHPWHVVGAGTGLYAIALMHYLDAVSGRALDTFRQVMDATDEQVAAVRTRLTTMPAGPVLEKASTWPWETAALRGFLTAIMLPLMVWAVEQAIARWLLVP